MPYVKEKRWGRKDAQMEQSGTKKKKLLVTASTFPRWEGDTEPGFILDLAAHMTGTFDITVLVPAAPGAKTEEVMKGVKVIRYHYFPLHRWETLCYPGAIVPRIREKKIRAFLVPFLLTALYGQLARRLSAYDLVHAHWLIPQGAVQSLFHKPYLVTGHGGDVSSLNTGICKWAKQRCLRRASGITAVSDSLKDVMEGPPYAGILAGRTAPVVIPMGVDGKKFGRRYRKENYFGQGGRKVVLFVGRLAEKKGVRYLIKAMGAKDMRAMEAMLVIAGDGPQREELVRQVRQQRSDTGQGCEILFLGAKPHEELRTIYASADVLAVPSVTAADGDKEGLPVTVLEAMASGLPVVASRTGGIGQVIEDGVNGLLCEEKNVTQLAAQIRRLLSDRMLREQIIENGGATALQYDYDVIAERYIAELEKAGGGI